MSENRWEHISAEDRAAIDDAVKQLHYVEKNERGDQFIELYADYTDTNEFLLDTVYQHRDDKDENGLLDAVRGAIDDGYDQNVWDTEDEILRKAGFDPNDDKAEVQKEYLRSTFPVVPPYDHYLDQTMKVNIFLRTPQDKDNADNLIHFQFLAMARPDELTDSSPEAIRELLNEDSSLKRLVEQQGHTMDELHSVMKEYMKDFYDPDGHPMKYRDENGKSLPYETRMDLFAAGKSQFLTSLCVELDNQTYSYGYMTVLAEVSIRQFAEMMKPGKEIKVDLDSNIGIFAPENGSGSILGIYLAKPLVFSREDIYDVQIEGAALDWGYSLDHTYGMCADAWKKPMSIKDKEPEQKASLDDIIQSAAGRAGGAGNPMIQHENER